MVTMLSIKMVEDEHNYQLIYHQFVDILILFDSYHFYKGEIVCLSLC